jgi:hypothetical protein
MQKTDTPELTPHRFNLILPSCGFLKIYQKQWRPPIKKTACLIFLTEVDPIGTRDEKLDAEAKTLEISDKECANKTVHRPVHPSVHPGQSKNRRQTVHCR